MDEQLYSEYPEAYDVLITGKNYDAEVEFVLSQFEEKCGATLSDSALSDSTDQPRALVVGCGTGKHSKRLREAGFEVVGVDKYEAMVERARSKSDAEFRVGALPDLPVEGEFDLVWLPFTVVQHVPPEDLPESLRAVADCLVAGDESSDSERTSSGESNGGLLVFDQIDTARNGTAPRLQTYQSEEGTYARITQVRAANESAGGSDKSASESDESAGESDSHSAVATRYRWDSLVFTPDGEFFADTHLLADYDPEYLVGICDVLGLSVERHGWYDEEAEVGDNGLTVFVAS